MTAQILHTTRQLDSRTSDGIDVRMLWNEHNGRVTVAVLDTKNGDAFTLRVLEDESAMDVFHHPYAYAAWHGVETAAPEPEIAFPERLAA